MMTQEKYDTQKDFTFQNPAIFNSEPGIWRGIVIPALPEPEIKIEFIDLGILPELNSTGVPSFRVALAETIEVFTTNLPRIDGQPDMKLTIGTPPQKAKTLAQFAIPAHKLDKQYPGEINQLARILEESDSPGKINIEIDGSFINIKLSAKELNNKVLDDIFRHGENYGSNNEGQGELVVMDVSSPNIAKEMHLGHLRSTVIGESIRRILQFNGYNVLRDNHVGDWGTQFGLLGRAVELWGDEVKDYLESMEPAKRIEGLLKLYVRINRQIAEEKSINQSSALEEDGRAWFVKLEAGDPEAVKFWRESSELSMLEFQEVYDKLRTEFEYILGESVYESSNQSVITAFKDAGLTFVDEKGVVKVTPSRQKGDALGIQKPDGSSLYGTRDLATIAARMHWFNPNKIVYVVGGDQNEYFVNLFDSMHQYLGTDEHLELVHVSFGAVELPEGPMSTRKGTVVPLRDVITTMEDKVRTRVSDNTRAREIELDKGELELIVGQVAIGSVIYWDLRGASKRKIIYDPEEITSFEGNSGAALQYTVARINSVLEKSGYNQEPTKEDRSTISFRDNASENQLMFRLGTFPDFVALAAERYEPYVIAEYLVGLASDYNSLIEKERIIDNPNTARKQLLLDVSWATRQVMKNGLALLNMPIPERM